MQVVRALANPARIRILDAIADGPATPRQLAERIGQSTGVTGYHLTVLRGTGCIRQLDAEQSGPAADRRYELCPEATPTRRLTASMVARTGPGHPPAELVRAAIERRTPNRGEDLFGNRENQLGCASIVVDEQGWREISAGVGELMNRIFDAERGSARRLSEDGGEAIGATVAVASFETGGRSAA